jgi:hypothetical protein
MEVLFRLQRFKWKLTKKALNALLKTNKNHLELLKKGVESKPFTQWN